MFKCCDPAKSHPTLAVVHGLFVLPHLAAACDYRPAAQRAKKPDNVPWTALNWYPRIAVAMPQAAFTSIFERCPMKLCILDNDFIDEAMAPLFGSYGTMTEKVLRAAGAHDWQIDCFSTPRGEYPDSFEEYDAVLLTGSKADSFSSDPWVVELRNRVSGLLASEVKLVGICFGHQLIALCMGADVGRAPQGWIAGRQVYQWHEASFPITGRKSVALLASHQDQVLTLPPGSTLLASSDNCPIAVYHKEDAVLCVQPHPEFVETYSEYLLNKRRNTLGEEIYMSSINSLCQGHEGIDFAKLIVNFIQKNTITAKGPINNES